MTAILPDVEDKIAGPSSIGVNKMPAQRRTA
jgi:hypothetical protein